MSQGGTATQFADGLWIIDLGFQGRQGVIAAYLIAGNGEVALIETGPSSTVYALVSGINAAGFALGDLTAVLLTHIHLDHAGAAGVLARHNPNLTVYVHPFGAPHMIDPVEADLQRDPDLRRANGSTLGRDRRQSRSRKSGRS